MSTIHNTGGRLWAWVLRHRLSLLAGAVVLAFVTVTFVSTFRLYDNRQQLEAERQFRLDAITEQARMNRMFGYDLCVGLNGANETLRNLLDASVRRITAASLTDEQLQLTIDTYRRLPSTDCETGAKTYFDPPFSTGGP